MASKARAKGNYHENYFVKLFKEWAIKVKKQPLSGSLGGEYSGDIKLELKGKELVGEVKYRDVSNFPSPFKVLEGRDIAFYKRRRGTPQTLVIMSGEMFEQLMENQDGITEQTDQSLP
jgi:hypothetical protein